MATQSRKLNQAAFVPDFAYTNNKQGDSPQVAAFVTPDSVLAPANFNKLGPLVRRSDPTGGGKGIFRNVITGLVITVDAWSKLTENEKSLFKFVTQAAQKGYNNMVGKKRGRGGSGSNGSNGSGGSGSNNNGSKGSSGGSSSYALSQAPMPQPIELKSGIHPNVYVSDYMDAVENKCSPLHLSQNVVRIPNSVASQLYTYFTELISFDIQSKAQANVGFNLNITNDFTSTKLLIAFNSLISALQVYYYYASIITYHSNPANKNSGMIFLRSGMTSNDYAALAKLNRRLRDTPCPPNIMKLIRYLSGNFLSGPNPGSPIYKIVPAKIGVNGLYAADELTAAFNALNTLDNNIVFSLLRRAVPQWIPSNLDDVPDVPVFDDQFLTIFANLPFTTASAVGVLTNFPAVVTTDETIQYNSYSNDLDGLSYALTSIDFGGTFLPGLMTTPQAHTGVGVYDSRMSFYTVSGVQAFYNARAYPFLVRSRQETCITNGTSGTAVGTSVHLPGTSRCLGVSINSINETSSNALDYLMSLDTIRKSTTLNRVRGK